jgi:hypothetical protein
MIQETKKPFETEWQEESGPLWVRPIRTDPTFGIEPDMNPVTGAHVLVDLHCRNVSKAEHLADL